MLLFLIFDVDVRHEEEVRGAVTTTAKKMMKEVNKCTLKNGVKGG